VKISNFTGSLYMQVVFVEKENGVSNSSTDMKILAFGNPEYFLVMPQIFLNKKPAQITELILQTLLPYCLGTSDKWLATIKAEAQLGYNCFHFPPLQEVGASGSLYSIRD